MGGAMSAREILGTSLFAMALVMVGWAYLAGIECGQAMNVPTTRFVPVSQVFVAWQDEDGCWHQSVVRGSIL